MVVEVQLVPITPATVDRPLEDAVAVVTASCTVAGSGSGSPAHHIEVAVVGHGTEAVAGRHAGGGESGGGCPGADRTVAIDRGVEGAVAVVTASPTVAGSGSGIPAHDIEVAVVGHGTEGVAGRHAGGGEAGGGCPGADRTVAVDRGVEDAVAEITASCTVAGSGIGMPAHHIEVAVVGHGTEVSSGPACWWW